MFNKLTVLVCLKDRADFTQRLCNYLSAINYPFLVYFADGSVGNENQEHFQSITSKNQLSFNYTYKRYPPDLLLLNYYQKCYQALCEVKTPYVMFADNDDFPVFEGQLKAIQFLDSNLDFIGCNGRVAGVTLYSDAGIPFGKNFLLHKCYCRTMDIPVKLNHELAADRICSYLNNFYSIFYSVFRVESLLYTHSKIQELNFSDVGIHELFLSYMQIAQGKIHSIDIITYVRQKGSSQAAASQKDWFYRLFYTNWLEDSKKAIKIVADYIATIEKTKFDNIYENLYNQFFSKMKSRYILNNFYLSTNFNSLVTAMPFILLNIVFRKIPMLTENFALKMFGDSHCIASLNAIKNAIIKK